MAIPNKNATGLRAVFVLVRDFAHYKVLAAPRLAGEEQALCGALRVQHSVVTSKQRASKRRAHRLTAQATAAAV